MIEKRRHRCKVAMALKEEAQRVLNVLIDKGFCNTEITVILKLAEMRLEQENGG